MSEEWYDFIKMIFQCAITSLLTTLLIFSIQDFSTGQELGDVNKFVALAEKWADTHTYNETEYNCINYSQDVYEIAQIMDIDADMMTGCPPEESNISCHRWLRVTLDFEPQHAAFTDYAEEYPLDRRIVR